MNGYWPRPNGLFQGLKTKTLGCFLLIVLLNASLIFSLTRVAASEQLALTDAEKLIALTNQARLENNLPPLFLNAALNQAAFNKAKNLLKEQYFSHNSPEGKKFSQWIAEVDYPYLIIGENLAMGFNSDDAIIQAWLASPKHQQNILDPRFKEIGLVVLKGEFNGETVKMVVQIFGATDEPALTEVFLPYQELPQADLKKILKISA